MNTVTVSKKEYDSLKKKVSLYEKAFRDLPEKGVVIEQYSQTRVRELMKEDSIDSKTKAKLKKLLNAS